MAAGDKRDGIYIDLDFIRDGVRSIVQNNNITNDAGWSAFIDGRSDAQLLALLRSYFKLLVKINGS